MIALAYPPYDPGMDRISGWTYLAVLVLLAVMAYLAHRAGAPPGRHELRAPVAEEEGPALPASGPDPAGETVIGPDGEISIRADGPGYLPDGPRHVFREWPLWSGPPLPDEPALVRPYVHPLGDLLTREQAGLMHGEVT